MNEMSKEALKELIDTAAGRNTADIVIKNCRIVDVLNGSIIEGDIAVIRGLIAGIGNYEGREEIDAKGKYAVPGFIDSHTLRLVLQQHDISRQVVGRQQPRIGAETADDLLQFALGGRHAETAGFRSSPHAGRGKVPDTPAPAGRDAPTPQEVPRRRHSLQPRR